MDAPLTGLAHRPASATYPPTARAGERTDVLGGRGRTKDGADQSEGKHGFHDERLGAGKAWLGQRGTDLADRAEGGSQEQARQDGPGGLRSDVTGHPSPLEVPAQREGEADHGVEVRPRDRTHGQDHGHHHQPRSHDTGSSPDAARLGIHDRTTRAHQNEQEGAEQLTEQPAPLRTEVGEVTRPRGLTL